MENQTVIDEALENRRFVNTIAGMSIWGFDKDNGDRYEECNEPDDGESDSHMALMGLIEDARKLKVNGPAQGVAFDKTVLVAINARPTEEWGENPNYALIKVDAKFIQNLKRYQNLCNTFGLAEVVVDGGPERWGDVGFEDPLMLQDDRLKVTRFSFGFTDYPKHSNYQIETRMLDIDGFIKAVTEYKGEKALCLAGEWAVSEAEEEFSFPDKEDGDK